jgi:hypothetical protein
MSSSIAYSLLTSLGTITAVSMIDLMPTLGSLINMVGKIQRVNLEPSVSSSLTLEEMIVHLDIVCC